jgi:hypothetical protein
MRTLRGAEPQPQRHQQVFTAIEIFLQGSWPQSAQIITAGSNGNLR